MATKVNLDALIPREDFEVKDAFSTGVTRNVATIGINDLTEESFFFSANRKPDFQRETNEWDVDKLCALIDSFLAGDLIPALILWRSAGSYTFVIDGSHRISALAAWVNDDYGDGSISKRFYDGVIPEEQLEIAETTRALIRKMIGPFSDYKLALRFPDKVRPEIFERAKSLGALAIQVQWVEGDASKAEASFFKINQQAAPLNPTELRLLKSRKKSNAIAARAIIRSGKGHKYWSRFTSDIQTKIQDLAKESYELLFLPKLNMPIKTLDVPVGGKIYSSQSLSLVLDFVNIACKDMFKSESDFRDDIDGNETIRVLSKAKKIAERINSQHPGSLGLHPLVYFYSQYGQYKVASFFAITALILEFERKNLWGEFIEIRALFEELLIQHDYLVQQIVRKYRSAPKAYENIKEFYIECIKELNKSKDIDATIAAVIQGPNFSYLTRITEETSEEALKDFSRETKSAAFIREALAHAVRCSICGGYLHVKSITIDHIIRKEAGGTGSLDNAQLAHPLCNSTIKN